MTHSSVQTAVGSDQGKESTMNRQTLTFVIKIDVDADQAAKLPGYPGTPSNDFGDDLPISGIEVEAQMIAQDIAVIAKDMIPGRLNPAVVKFSNHVSPVLEMAEF